MTDLPYHEFLTFGQVEDLKVGEQIIQIHPISTTWVRGQIGTVVGFSDNVSGDLCVEIQFPGAVVSGFHHRWFRDSLAVVRDPPESPDEWADEFEFEI